MHIGHIKYCALALLSAFLSCTREGELADGAEELLTATAPVSQPLTRSQIDDSGIFTWEADDKIAIHYSNGFPAYSDYRAASLKEGDGTATAKFALIPGGIRDGFALYPSVIADKDCPGLSGGTLRVNIPQSYPL